MSGFTVAELIEELQAIEDKTLPVVLYCDHGQSAMKPFAVYESAVYDIDEFMGEITDDDEDGVPVVLIEA